MVLPFADAMLGEGGVREDKQNYEEGEEVQESTHVGVSRSEKGVGKAECARCSL